MLNASTQYKNNSRYAHADTIIHKQTKIDNCSKQKTTQHTTKKVFPPKHESNQIRSNPIKIKIKIQNRVDTRKIL